MEHGSLQGRSVLVTGGSMGIGAACAEAALAAGASVTISARGADALERTRARLAAMAPGRVHAVACDVSAEVQVRALFEAVRERFGAVDGVVHAAAVMGPIGRAEDIAAGEWLATVHVDLFGTFLVAREAARLMRAAGSGRIVLLSGGGGTGPFPHFSAYACSKAAVVRLAETLALELAGSGVQVNALAPGFVATRMHQATLEAGTRAGADYLQRTRAQLEAGGVPAEQSAAAAVFLLDERSDGISGRLLAVPWDDYTAWPERLHAIRDSDLFTVRRIVPADRGLAW